MNSIELLTVEIFERAIRIINLVQRATRPLLASGKKASAQLASANQITKLLQSLVIEELASLHRGDDSEPSKIAQLSALMEVLAIVHEGTLPTIPRIVEPIELHSYLRQGSGGNAGHKHQALVFAAERLGMQVYPNSLAGLLKTLAYQHKLQARARHYSSDIATLAIAKLSGKIEDSEKGPQSNSEPYVAIPAVDIHNPTRWPSLWHELGHHELNVKPEGLLDRFAAHLSEHPRSNSLPYRNLCLEVYWLTIDPEGVPRDLAAEETGSAVGAGEEVISHWLRECWCDGFGVRQAGLGFLYSQLHDFMFCWPNYLSANFKCAQLYPPAWFRLRLSKNLAIERLKHQTKLPDPLLVDDLVRAYQEEEARFLSLAPDADNPVRPKSKFANLLSHFLHFLKEDIGSHENKNLDGDVTGAAFKDLEDDLKLGLPIPAILDRASNTSRAAQVSEIILAGWRARNTSLRDRLLHQFKQLVAEQEQLQTCIQNASDLIDRADNSIKRSIQVAEWFSILSPGQDKAEHSDEQTHLAAVLGSDNPTPDFTGNTPGLISDDEINRLLRFDGDTRPILRIVPLINRTEQVKGTVIDVRLGHNFEIFQNHRQVAIDACDPTIDDRVDSLETEIDFLEGLPILPGQFILGHTLEYIKLPKNIAAQIEGRSSFARLGIQVHMTANLVEAGFEGCLTLEILNSGPSTVVLYPGMRLAQLRFFRITGVAQDTYSRVGNKYHGQLSQNRTKQFSDPEVAIFRKFRKMRDGAKGGCE